MHMVTVSAIGGSNGSQSVYFTTSADTTEAHSSLSVKPVEVFLVVIILITWLLTIAMFIKKWSTLRIISTNEFNYRAKKPQGIDSVQVVDAASESVINISYSKNMCKTMAERQRRFERMHTMPNMKIDLEIDPSESQNQDLEPRPRFNSEGSKSTMKDSVFELKSVNPMSFAIPTMIVKSKGVRQTTVLDPCIEESYGAYKDSPRRSSCKSHSKGFLPYTVENDDTTSVNTSTV